MRQRLTTQQQQTAVQAEPIPQVVAQGLVQAAFVDPSDPTQLFISGEPK